MKIINGFHVKKYTVSTINQPHWKQCIIKMQSSVKSGLHINSQKMAKGQLSQISIFMLHYEFQVVKPNCQGPQCDK